MMTIAAPARTMIATNVLMMTETEATLLTRIAMTETGDLGVDAGDAAVRGNRPTASAPTDLAPSQLALPHRPVPRNRDATVAAARAGRPTEAASPIVDSPLPVAHLIADRLPLVAMVARHSNHNPNLHLSPKVDAVAVSVAVSAVLPATASPGICKTPPSPPAMSSANWSR